MPKTFRQGWQILIDTVFPTKPSPDEYTTLSFAISIGIAVSTSAALAIAATCANGPSSDTCHFYGSSGEAVGRAVYAMTASAMSFTWALTTYMVLMFLKTVVDAGTLGDPSDPRIHRAHRILLSVSLDIILAFVCGGLYFLGEGLEVVNRELGMVLKFGAVVGVGAAALTFIVLLGIWRGVQGDQSRSANASIHNGPHATVSPSSPVPSTPFRAPSHLSQSASTFTPLSER